MIISYSRKETKNLGNFESVTINISAEDNVDFAKENSEECFERLREFVITHLHKEFAQASIKLERVQAKLQTLLTYDISYKFLIKDILDSYKVGMLNELTKEQLEFFDKKVDELIKDHEINGKLQISKLKKRKS